MPERQAHDTDPAAPPTSAPATPRVSGEQRLGLGSFGEPEAPVSSTRAAQASELPVPSEPGDTLLSAGKPADRLELLLEDRLGVQDDRIEELDARLRELDSRLLVLEHKKSIRAPESRQKPWLWIVFMIALVVVFQLLRRVR